MAPNVGLGTEGSVQRGWGLWLTSVLAVLISTLFVGARLAQRYVKKVGLGLDDYMIMAALLSSGLLSLTECQAVVYGYGKHYAVLPHDARTTARKWFYGANIVYKVVLLFNKISVVCLYYRIFAISNDSFRKACYYMNAWITISGLAFIVATIFQCRPMAAFWDRSIPGYKCFKNEPWWISYAATQITTDFMLLFMPVREVLRLSMGKAEKLGICLIFGTGIFVTFASIYRATTIAASASDPDPTWGPIPATIWSVIEANAGIVCACLPMLRGPFVRLFGPIFGSHSATSKPFPFRLIGYSGHLGAVTGGSEVRGPAAASAVSFDCESEQGMMKGEDPIMLNNSNLRACATKHNHIMVTNEFTIATDNLGRSKMVRDEDVSASSVNEERVDDKKPFLHI